MNDWFKKWFSSDEYLTVYSHRNEDDAEKIIDLVLRVTGIQAHNKILDAACGAGRHSIILSQKGFDVTAFDLSKNLLKIGSQNARELDADVKFLCSDIRTVAFKPVFDLVLNMFTSFGYFETDLENFKFFVNAKRFLKMNGFIVLDYLNESYVRNNLNPKSIKQIDGKKITETRVIKDDRIIKNISITTESNTHEYLEAVKLYSRDYIVKIFSDNGYKLFFEAGDYFGNEFDSNKSERLILFFRL